MKACIGKRLAVVAATLAMALCAGTAWAQATTETFSSSTTWTAPPGVISLTVEAWGGGGGGGASTGNPAKGGGGAGGQYVKKVLTVTPGNAYAIVVGAGGNGGSSSAGGSGGDSTFGGTSAVAKGGGGGGLASSNNSGGTAGTGSTSGGVGDTIYAGGSGSAGSASGGNCNSGGAGGGGAGSSGAGGSASGNTAGTGTATGGGNGGAGSNSSSNGNPGSDYGGGGAGGCAESNTNRTGGAGGAGYVTLTYMPTGTAQLCDGFESGLSGYWTVTNVGGSSPYYGTAVIDTSVKHAGSQSMRMSRDWVRATSKVYDLSSGSGPITFWAGAGLDPSAPDYPEPGDDLQVEYLNSSSVWTTLTTVTGQNSSQPFTQYSVALPANAKHANFQLRFTQLLGSGNATNDYDQWHIDDVCLGTVQTLASTAAYRFDECNQYTGASGEVADSAGSYPGTPKGSLQNATPGQVLRYADFSNSTRYVDVPSGPSMTGDWSIGVWFKMPFADSSVHSSQYYVIASVSGGGDFLYLDRNSSGGSYRWGVYTSSGSTDGSFRFSTLSDGWHHMVLVGEGAATKLYIDGIYRDQVARKATGTFRYLGASADNAGTTSGQSFGSPLDEFEIYSYALAASSVSALYNNESAGKNADGSIRSSTCLTCFTDSFTGSNGSSPGTNWTTTNTSGSFGHPKIYNNRLRLTDATTNVATAAHLQRMFPGAGNKIIVEFDYFAYNGSGADGIVLALSDASVAPQAGAYGGSLGYAQQTGINGFAGGWLGVGIDEYGNFPNPTEGRSGGPGFVVDSVTIRGSGSGQTGYAYHANSGTLSPGIDQSGSTPAPGHRYRMTLDHSDGVHAYVKVERDISGTGSSYTTIIPQYDAKVQSGQAAVPTNWMLSYTGSTGGSTNIHEIDNLSVCTTQPILTSGPNHIRIEHGGSGVTCSPTTLTIKACADASCSTLYTGGVTGTLTATGTPTVNWVGGSGFTIGSSGSVTKGVQVTTAGTVAWDTTGNSPAPSAGTSCYVGATSSCSFTSALAGFLFDVPDHYADTTQSVAIKAVKQADNSLSCTPAFASTSKSVSFGCSYSDPTSGSSPVIVGGTSLSCGTAGNVSLNFDATGTATTTVRYADVGKMGLTAAYSGTSGSEAGLSMTGTDTFIAAPASFAVVPSGTYVAGSPFTVTVTAKNASGNTTPNFGKESTTENVSLGHTLTGPAGGYDPAFSGTTVLADATFASGNGVAANGNVIWGEVGDIAVTATLASGSYLGSGLSATGSGAAGAFKPAYFDTAVTPGTSGSFTYSGQPFSVTVTAKNASGTTTKNYAGAYAKAVTLTDANSATNNSGTLGSFANATIPSTSFVSYASNPSTAGTATVSTVAYTFANKTTAPLEGANALKLRATDTAGVTSSGHTEGTTPIRSGRVVLSNAHGSEKLGLTMPVQVQYWTGSAWATNTLDTGAAATSLAGLVVTSATPCATPTVGALGSGKGSLTFAAPGAKCSVYVCALLADDADNDVTACRAGASALPWLQGSWDGDGNYNDNPWASATFGVYQGRAPVIYRRERY